jgi:hypothetical protein
MPRRGVIGGKTLGLAQAPMKWNGIDQGCPGSWMVELRSLAFIF